MELKLFSGVASPFGGLSNEQELVKLCPEKFKKENDWGEYAIKIFYSGGIISKWKYKNTDKKEQNKQRACFKGLLSTFGIPHEDKEAVSGWMLSEMLTEVPKYIPRDKD